MSWSKKRIKEYQQGQDATWLERRVLEHAEPVHLTLQIISLPFLVYGLWTHDWVLIIIGIALNLVGHIYTWVK